MNPYARRLFLGRFQNRPSASLIKRHQEPIKDSCPSEEVYRQLLPLGERDFSFELFIPYLQRDPVHPRGDRSADSGRPYRPAIPDRHSEAPSDAPVEEADARPRVDQRAHGEPGPSREAQLDRNYWEDRAPENDISELVSRQRIRSSSLLVGM